MSEPLGLNKDEIRALKKESTRRNDRLEGGRTWRVLDFLVYLLAVVVFALAIRAVVVEPVKVKGESMYETLHPGDYMVVEKLTYVFREPKLGDVVIIWYPQNKDYTCVKRVIGVEGDHIVIQDGYVTINGELLDDEEYVYRRAGNHDCDVIVDEGCVFVLGDNRIVSKDSTSLSVGSIPIENIVGRVRMVLWPFDRIIGFN